MSWINQQWPDAGEPVGFRTVEQAGTWVAYAIFAGDDIASSVVIARNRKEYKCRNRAWKMLTSMHEIWEATSMDSQEDIYVYGPRATVKPWA